MKKLYRYYLSWLIWMLCLYTTGYSQTMTRQDKLFIQKGIYLHCWVRNDQAGELVPVPAKQVFLINRTGRYVRVQIPTTEPLHLAEVQVFSGGANVALSRPANQSTTLAPASRAVDGNTSGDYANASTSHTTIYTETEPWWEVDMGNITTIDSIVIWNRTDCCSDRLKGCYLFVSDQPFAGPTLLSTITQAGVSRYQQPLGSSVRIATAAELAYGQFVPAYYEIPKYNYTVLREQDPTLNWSIAKAAKPLISQGNYINRGPSTAEQTNGFLNSLQVADLDRLKSICVGDEEAYSTTMTEYMKSWFDVIRNKYPTVIYHSNQYFSQWSLSQLRTYTQRAKPDMLTFDYYYFYQNVNPSPGNAQPRLYQDLQAYRQLALEGHDGTGSAPIGFGGYLQAFKGKRNGGSYNYTPSESEFNLGAFAYLTMGAKWINAFIYHALFYAGNNLTPQYYQYAHIGRMMANLSPHLSRLRTSDVRFIPGQHLSGGAAVNNAAPNNIPAWSAAADPYVTSIVASNLVPATNDGLKGDVLIGYFRPVPGLINTPGITMAPVPNTYTRYFMILNGLNKSNGCCSNPALDTIQGKANLATQRITLSINFGNNPVDTLYRVTRSDGVVEIVPLTQVSGSQYTVSDTLDGGLADLFFWKNQGAPPPPNTGKSILLTSGKIAAGDVTALNGANKFTVETWVKFNNIGDWHTLFSKQTSTNYRLLLQTHSDKSIYVNVSNGANNYGRTPINVINTGQWYHMAVVFDGTQATNAARLKLYINGSPISLTYPGTIPSSTSSSNAPFLVGSGCTGCATGLVDGTIDEVRVWNTALTQSILNTWKDKILGSCHPNAANLTLYWQLNDNSQPAVAVASMGTTYAGSIVNGAYVAGGQATGANGCSLSRLAAVHMPHKTENPDLPQLKVYPNPVLETGILQIEINLAQAAHTTISIFDIFGRSVFKVAKRMEVGLTTTTASLAGQAKGVYIIEVNTGKQIKRVKVLKP